MPLPSKKSFLFAMTALLVVGVAEAMNLLLGHAGILQNAGKGSLDLPPWLEKKKEREEEISGQETEEGFSKRRCDGILLGVCLEKKWDGRPHLQGCACRLICNIQFGTISLPQ